MPDFENDDPKLIYIIKRAFYDNSFDATIEDRAREIAYAVTQHFKRQTLEGVACVEDAYRKNIQEIAKMFSSDRHKHDVEECEQCRALVRPECTYDQASEIIAYLSKRFPEDIEIRDLAFHELADAINKLLLKPVKDSA